MPDSAVPTLIGQRYEVGDLLGRGGMAEVYAGVDRRLMRPVAIKLLQTRMAARDDVRARFETEAQSAAQLSHPAAVAVFDTGEHDGIPYIVMERLPGETLADRISAGPVDPEWLRGVSSEVLGALGAAHAVGLVHRDVKPGNILITEDGHAKIADFGIAKSVDPTAVDSGGLAAVADLTGTGQLLGTPAYLAPERIEGRPATASSDIYGLGVVLYEALAGTKPFSGETPLATAGKIVAGEHPPLGEIRPGLDPALVATVERAMARVPEARFASAADMAGALATTGADATLLSADDASLVREPTMVLDAADLAAVAAAGVVGAAAAGAEADTGAAPVATAAARALGARASARRPGAFAARRRPPTAWLVVLGGLALLAILLVAQLGGDGSGSNTADAGAGTATTTAATRTTTAPATTAVDPARAAVAGQLRDLAGRLGPGDGPAYSDLANRLNDVATRVEAGSAGPSAGALIVEVGLWARNGQLVPEAAAIVVSALANVPGVDLSSFTTGAAGGAGTATSVVGTQPGRGKKGKGGGED